MSFKQPPKVPPVQTTIKCDGCDSEFDIRWFCKSCPASLCDSCKTKHKKDRFRSNHKIVPRTGSVIRKHDSSKVTESCPDHPEKTITGYCNDCFMPCCMSCVAENHRRHDITDIEMKYIECEDMLNDMATNLQKHALVQLQNSVEEFRELLHTNRLQFETVKKEVTSYRQELKDAVDTVCDSFIQELDQNEKEQKNDIGVVIKDLENSIGENERFIYLCGEKIRNGGLSLIQFCKARPPISTIPSYPNSIRCKPVFVPGVEIFQMIMENVGKVKWDDKESGSLLTSRSPRKSKKKSASILKMGKGDKNKPMTIPISEEMSASQANVEISIIDVKVLHTFDIQIRGSTVLPAGMDTAFMSYEYGDALFMYDYIGGKVKSVIVEKEIGIWDIAVKRSGEVIVCNRDNKVRLVNVNGKVSTLVDTAPFSPQGVCLTDTDEILVCMAEQRDQNHVVVYSCGGKKKVREIVVKDSQGEQMLTDPYRVVINGADISILNHMSNVVTIGKNKKLRWVYGHQQARVEMFEGAGMCVDRSCNLIISDAYNACVHYLDREGLLIKILMTKDELGKGIPWGIGVDAETGKLWVGCFGSKVWVIEYRNF